MIDLAKMFLSVPLVLATEGQGWSIHGLNAGYYNLLHQADLTINGKIVEQIRPHLNVYTHLKTICQMSQDET